MLRCGVVRLAIACGRARGTRGTQVAVGDGEAGRAAARAGGEGGGGVAGGGAEEERGTSTAPIGRGRVVGGKRDCTAAQVLGSWCLQGAWLAGSGYKTGSLRQSLQSCVDPGRRETSGAARGNQVAPALGAHVDEGHVDANADAHVSRLRLETQRADV